MRQLKQKTTEAPEHLQAAAVAAADKKAERIIVLDVSQTLAITDHFLICSGNSERQVHTIAEAIERRLSEEWSIKPLRREGHRDSRWVILDYVDFLVHAFHREERDYYDLERLWADAPVLELHQREDGYQNDEPAARAEAP
ncbi:MAG TPA: ribosome silencing factor [Actinomycetota bacterium]|nr:ribosome silencing factor [Actinomycetota bacterium]